MNREQAERALVNAHKAGDIESAKKIASAIKGMQAPATPEQMEIANPINRLATGALDPGLGIAQGAAHAIGSPVGEALKQEPGMSNLPFVGGLVGIANQIPGAVSKVADAGMAASEKKYEDARKAVGNTGVDWMRAAGNVAIGAPMGLLGGPTGAAERIASAVATGATFPVDASKGYAGEKTKQAAISGVTAGFLEGLGSLAKTSKDKFINTLRSQGIKPTPGRTVGGVLGSIEDRATSIPVVGDAIQSARKQSLDELNRAAYKYALDPIGENVNDIPVGRDAIAAIERKLSTAYNDVLPLIQFKPDAKFANELSDLAVAAKRLAPEQQAVYKATMEGVVLPRLRGGREIDGNVLKEVESYLGSKAANYATGGPTERELAVLLRDVKGAIRENLIRSNPRMADKLQAIDQGWRAYDVLARAGGGAKASEGFTPNALSTAVKQASNSYRKRAYSKGDAFMQELSDAASARLPSQYPDSGTAGRSLLAEGAGLMLSPAAIPYLPGFRGISSSIAANRLGGVPGMSALSGAARQISPFAGAASPTLQQLLFKDKHAPESD